MTDIPETAMRVRHMYADGVTIANILLETKMTLDRVYYWVDGGNGRMPALPRRRLVGHGFGARSKRATIIARMLRVLERQLRDVERRIAAEDLDGAPEPGRDKQAAPQSDRNNRDVALLARSMREVIALEDASHRGHKPLSEKNRSNDDDVPRNIDELRQKLLRKMDALIADEEGEVGPDSGP